MIKHEQQVRERAYYIWEDEGRVCGRADAHWFQAQAELAAAQTVLTVQPVAEATVPAPAKALAKAVKPAVSRAKKAEKAPAKAASKAEAPKAAVKARRAPRAAESAAALH